MQINSLDLRYFSSVCDLTGTGLSLLNRTASDGKLGKGLEIRLAPVYVYVYIRKSLPRNFFPDILETHSNRTPTGTTTWRVYDAMH